MSNVIQYCFGFALHCSVIALSSRTSQDSLKQSDSKLVATQLSAFSRTSGGFFVLRWVLIGPISDWLFLFLVLQHLIEILAEIRKEKKTDKGGGGENDNQE